MLKGIGTKGRLEGCDIAANTFVGVMIQGGAAPSLRDCIIREGKDSGVIVVNAGTRGRLERCELWGNADGGVWVGDGGDPTLAACTLRDHAAGSACGVFVLSTALGKATVGADCVFARNAKGDVVREVAGAAPLVSPPPLPAPVRLAPVRPAPVRSAHPVAAAEAMADSEGCPGAQPM